MSKTIFRTNKDKDNPYVMMDKRPIENPALSWKAKGILSYLLSRPDDWVVRIEDLIKRSPDGDYAVRSAVKELTAAGHITRRYDRDDNGRIKEVVLEVYEQPFRGFPQVGNQQVGNRAHTNKRSVTNKKKTNVARDVRLDHPAIKAYRDLARLTPPHAWRDDIIQTVTDVPKWQGIVKEWIGKSWKPGNIEGMLDVYRNGWQKNGHSPQHPPAKKDSAEEVELARRMLRGEA